MRLFLAVWPPPDVLDTLDGLARPPDPRVRWIPREALHVTIRFLGDQPGDVHELTRALSTLGVDEPIRAVVGPETTVLGRRILCVPVDGLDPLASECDAALERSGFGPRDHPFRGHLTLARAVRGAPAPALFPHAGQPVETLFSVESLAIVESTASPGGSAYRSLVELPIYDSPPMGDDERRGGSAPGVIR